MSADRLWHFWATSSLVAMAATVAILVMHAGCKRERGAQDPPAKGEDDFLQIDEETTGEERGYLQAAKPFAVALAAGKYQEAYELLSGHAKARMWEHQFVPPDDADAGSENAAPLENASADQFAQQMQKVSERYGPPRSVGRLYVQSTEREVLEGRGEPLDVMLAIGNMPKEIPAEIRRASLRGQIVTRFTPEELKRVAEQVGVTTKEIEQDDEYQPYYNFKLVLVQEGEKLKVGYFELMPPSILD